MEIYAADGYGNHRVAALTPNRRDQARVGRLRQTADRRQLRPTIRFTAVRPNPVHCIGLAKDGLVYVCDRINNRVQVFHKNGGFCEQFVFDPKTRAAVTWALPSRRSTEAIYLFETAPTTYRDGPPSTTVSSGGVSAARPRSRRIPLGPCRQFDSAAISTPAKSIPENAAKMGADGMIFRHPEVLGA